MAGIIGPQVMLLLPVWWVGCWVCDAYLAWRRTRVATVVLGVCVVAVGLALIGHGAIGKVFWAIAGARNPIEMLGMPARRATMFAVAVGVFAAVGLLVMLLVVDFVKVSRNSRWARGFRRMAEGTFTIYLMHYPFLVLLMFLGLLPPGRVWMNILVAVTMCAILIGVAVPVNMFKLAIRRWLRSVFREV